MPPGGCGSAGRGERDRAARQPGPLDRAAADGHCPASDSGTVQPQAVQTARDLQCDTATSSSTSRASAALCRPGQHSTVGQSADKTAAAPNRGGRQLYRARWVSAGRGLSLVAPSNQIGNMLFSAVGLARMPSPTCDARKTTLLAVDLIQSAQPARWPSEQPHPEDDLGHLQIRRAPAFGKSDLFWLTGVVD